ncbi:MAG: hypothetical protein Q8K74_12375, partial [Candidatus Nitrotoga sp.]|nr:hypothetical protein [Candidatus Nitrotoga sp.]MDP1856812.1 hypothetical protein [Candidatus Nitrotoga sp.]
NGRCHLSLGVLPKPNSPFCSVNASRIQFENAVKFNRDFRHTKFLTLPWLSGMELRQSVLPCKFETMCLLIAIKAVYQRSRGTYDPKKIRDKLAGSFNL